MDTLKMPGSRGSARLRPREPESALPETVRRVAIEAVEPQVDGGRFAAKRTAGDEVDVEADLISDGHDVVTGIVLHRHEADPQWSEAPLVPIGNDRWRATFTVPTMGRHLFTLEAWVDRFGTWQSDIIKKLRAGQDIRQDLATGARLAQEAASTMEGPEARRLKAWSAELERIEPREPQQGDWALDEDVHALLSRHARRSGATRLGRELTLWVDSPRARASAWYEFFPRSCAPEGGRHGTLRDAEQRLEYVASMGFDTVYLPPIHPIGRANRKGLNNAEEAGPDDVGSPWAIGSAEGGHKAIHPRLGTLEDFQHFLAAARGHGLDVALDLAFQCSPDHPYTREHPEWFRVRPDRSIQYAENPPKKYQDIVPFNFESPQWPDLWAELRDVVEFWIQQGVQTFRVDNPHTKPLPFWEWLIEDVHRRHPQVLFLAEAFTRPKLTHRLAKVGFSHSYTYFAWRNTKDELSDYLTELTRGPARDYVRPHLWPNTPDILTQQLRTGGRSAFASRFILAATLGANYGVYGPAFELLEARPAAPDSEEYLDSEKYQIRQWDLDRPDSLKPLIALVNRIRRENPALQSDAGLRFHRVGNDHILAYSKATRDGSNAILAFVNVDPHRAQSGMTDLDLGALGLADDQEFQVHDLLTEARYVWRGRRNYVELRPHEMPAHLFRLRRHVRTEHDFDYYA